MFASFIRRRMLQSYVGFVFLLYFHIRSSDKSIIAKMGVFKGIVNIFPTTQPPCWRFMTEPLF